MKLDKSTKKVLVRDLRRRARDLFKRNQGGKIYWYTCPEICNAGFKAGVSRDEIHKLAFDYRELLLDDHVVPFDELMQEERLNLRALSLLFFANMIESGLYD